MNVKISSQLAAACFGLVINSLHYQVDEIFSAPKQLFRTSVLNFPLSTSFLPDNIKKYHLLIWYVPII